MEIKSIQLISNNICCGPEPDMEEEIEQHLTVTASGRVCFFARNYAQYQAGEGFCRQKQINISSWRAEFLLQIIDNVSERPMGKDYGTYHLVIRYADRSIKRLCGSLREGTSAPVYGTMTFVTKLLRRYIPVYALWGFDGNLSPDYEGKKEIFKFAKSWGQKFSSGQITGQEFEGFFGKKCAALGFQMDCGKEFNRLYPNCCNVTDRAIDTVIPSVQDVDLLGSAVFSQWRYLTHWTMYQLDRDTCHWFDVLLKQIEELTRNKQ